MFFPFPYRGEGGGGEGNKTDTIWRLSVRLQSNPPKSLLDVNHISILSLRSRERRGWKNLGHWGVDEEWLLRKNRISLHNLIQPQSKTLNKR